LRRGAQPGTAPSTDEALPISDASQWGEQARPHRLTNKSDGSPETEVDKFWRSLGPRNINRKLATWWELVQYNYISTSILKIEYAKLAKQSPTARYLHQKLYLVLFRRFPQSVALEIRGGRFCLGLSARTAPAAKNLTRQCHGHKGKGKYHNRHDTCCRCVTRYEVDSIRRHGLCWDAIEVPEEFDGSNGE
jgi:hypothetical protein